MSMSKFTECGPCVSCGKEQPWGNKHYVGKDMWHWTVWTCGHQCVIECDECYKKHPNELPYPECTVCGNNCSYT